MAQERPTKKRGGITGRAYVVMGGKVALGTYDKTGISVVSLWPN
jgi:hypothetical protein